MDKIIDIFYDRLVRNNQLFTGKDSLSNYGDIISYAPFLKKIFLQYIYIADYFTENKSLISQDQLLLDNIKTMEKESEIPLEFSNDFAKHIVINDFRSSIRIKESYIDYNTFTTMILDVFTEEINQKKHNNKKNKSNLLLFLENTGFYPITYDFLRYHSNSVNYEKGIDKILYRIENNADSLLKFNNNYESIIINKYNNYKVENRNIKLYDEVKKLKKYFMSSFINFSSLKGRIKIQLPPKQLDEKAYNIKCYRHETINNKNIKLQTKIAINNDVLDIAGVVFNRKNEEIYKILYNKLTIKLVKYEEFINLIKEFSLQEFNEFDKEIIYCMLSEDKLQDIYDNYIQINLKRIKDAIYRRPFNIDIFKQKINDIKLKFKLNPKTVTKFTNLNIDKYFKIYTVDKSRMDVLDKRNNINVISNVNNSFINRSTCIHNILEKEKGLVGIADTFAVENKDGIFVCSSCGDVLGIERLVVDGTFVEDLDKLLTTKGKQDLSDEYNVSLKIIDILFETIINKMNLTNKRDTTDYIEITKKDFIKNIFLFIDNHKIDPERNMLEYGVNNKMSYLIPINLKNKNEKKEYTVFKINIIISYLVIFFLLELNKIKIQRLTISHESNYYIFNILKENMFKGFKLNTKKGNVDLLDYEILCYVIFLFGNVILSKRLWEYTDKNIEKKVLLKSIITTIIDLLVTILNVHINDKIDGKYKEIYDKIITSNIYVRDDILATRLLDLILVDKNKIKIKTNDIFIKINDVVDNAAIFTNYYNQILLPIIIEHKSVIDKFSIICRFYDYKINKLKQLKVKYADDVIAKNVIDGRVKDDYDGNTINGNTINKDTINGNTINGNTINKDTINGNTINKDTINGNTINKDTIDVDTINVDNTRLDKFISKVIKKVSNTSNKKENIDKTISIDKIKMNILNNIYIINHEFIGKSTNKVELIDEYYYEHNKDLIIRVLSIISKKNSKIKMLYNPNTLQYLGYVTNDKFIESEFNICIDYIKSFKNIIIDSILNDDTSIQYLNINRFKCLLNRIISSINNKKIIINFSESVLSDEDKLIEKYSRTIDHLIINTEIDNIDDFFTVIYRFIKDENIINLIVEIMILFDNDTLIPKNNFNIEKYRIIQEYERYSLSPLYVSDEQDPVIRSQEEIEENNDLKEIMTSLDIDDVADDEVSDDGIAEALGE